VSSWLYKYCTSQKVILFNYFNDYIEQITLTAICSSASEATEQEKSTASTSQVFSGSDQDGINMLRETGGISYTSYLQVMIDISIKFYF